MITFPIERGVLMGNGIIKLWKSKVKQKPKKVETPAKVELSNMYGNIDGVVIKPYSLEDYEDAEAKGLDLDTWEDYKKYYKLGEES